MACTQPYPEGSPEQMDSETVNVLVKRLAGTPEEQVDAKRKCDIQTPIVNSGAACSSWSDPNAII